MNTYPWEISPKQMTKQVAQQGYSFELRGNAFLNVEEACWLVARHEWLDCMADKAEKTI